MHTSLLIPSHRIADKVVDVINRILDFLGLEHHPLLQEIIYFVFIVAIGLTAGWLVRKILVWAIRKVFEHIAAAAPAFGLLIYNAADGSDLIIHEGSPVNAGPPPGPINLPTPAPAQK